MLICMKVSTRINGRVTSIRVKNSVCALHYMVCAPPNKNIESHVLDTCHTIMSQWEGRTGKGISGFITDKMLEDLLELNDVSEWQAMIKRLEANG